MPFTERTLEFLFENRVRDSKSWFEENRAEYENVVLQPLRELVTELTPQMLALDSQIICEPKVGRSISRIYRDTRFSSDKTPYKNHFGGYINAKGKKSYHSGYYIHIQPEGCMLAGGSLCLPSNILKALRQSIYDNIDEYRSIVEDPEFQQFFPIVGEDFLKTAPKGFPKDFKYIDYLKPKEFTCAYSVPDSFFLTPDILDKIEEVFRQFKRFADFTNFTIDDFE